MSRPTLKLPAKSAPPATAEDTRRASRKPVRSGATAPKQSIAQRASALAAKKARLAAESSQWVRPPRPGPDLPRPPAREAKPVATPAADAVRNDLPPRREPAAPKAYPKRGIARSTGARALPPPRASAVEAPPRPQVQAAPPLAVPVVQPRPDTPSPTVAAVPPRRPLHEPPRLAKRITEMTQCSRREADEWIENGWVRVDGVVVTTLGTRVHPNARVEIREEASKHQTESVTILLNKPLDEASEGGGEAALKLIRAENRWAEDDTRYSFKATHLRGLAVAGRLDAEATGMLVFTQEGSVARRITGDDTRLEKEYMVRVEGELTPEGMKLLNHGLALDEVKLKRAQVSWQNEQQLRFVLHESRKQQIQRMCELVGLRVTSIKRIRIGSVSLGKLPAGKWRYLRDNERF